MCKNLKMWLTDLLTDKRTDRRTDKRVAGGHYCWGVLLWPPQLGLGGKCDKKWKFKNVEKITSFSDAVTLTFDLRPGKVNQITTNVYTKFENNPSSGFWVIALTPLRAAGGGRRAAGGGRLRRKTITSPDPSDTGDIINNIPPLVQIMAWRCSGDKPLSEPMLVSLLTHICVAGPRYILSFPHLWLYGK